MSDQPLARLAVDPTQSKAKVEDTPKSIVQLRGDACTFVHLRVSLRVTEIKLIQNGQEVAWTCTGPDPSLSERANQCLPDVDGLKQAQGIRRGAFAPTQGLIGQRARLRPCLAPRMLRGDLTRSAGCL